MKALLHSIIAAIIRCRKWILVIFLVYCFSALTGLLMVHNGNSFALSYRDNIIRKAEKSDQASINYAQNNRFRAAMIDFGGNLVFGAFTQTFIGLGVVFPFISTAYQGWIGGIVSVNDQHRSRLTSIKPASYYFSVLLLQFIPYSLAIGAGVRLGIETYRLNMGKKIREFRIDRSSLKDVGYIYIAATPLFFIASCFEFLSNWNG
jgi:hypothetical protein